MKLRFRLPFKIMKRKDYYKMKGLDDNHKALQKIINDIFETNKNTFMIIWNDEIEKLPKRCKQCRKKIVPFDMKFSFGNGGGIGFNTYAEHECGKVYDISDYDSW